MLLIILKSKHKHELNVSFDEGDKEMIRKIIKIDEEKCNGCGLCAKACHEGAIGMVNGKAKLLRDDYCDGLGDCLPVCPVDAISFEEREAAAYDEAAVKANMAAKASGCSGGCPGSQSRVIESSPCSCSSGNDTPADIPSALTHWPVQIKLAPISAPYFEGADLLIAADCCAYAYGNFHGKFMEGKKTLIGCPKLDMIDYSEKLTAIISSNDIKSLAVARMEVPCCGGMEYAVKQALSNSGKDIPLEIVTVGIDGTIKDTRKF